MGNPNDNVKIRCLDKLKVYGISPIILIKIIVINSEEMIEDLPLIWKVEVRDNWPFIIEKNSSDGVLIRADNVQNGSCMSIISIMFVDNKIVDDWWVE